MSRMPVTCANPLCGKEVETYSHPIKVEQKNRGSWNLCSPECLKQWIALCLLRLRAVREEVELEKE